MNDLTVVEPINADIIRSRILTIRGVQVMLSSDLSDLYEVEVKHLHRQVKRNTGRFPSDFVIHLSPEEVKGLRCQNVTSKRGGCIVKPLQQPKNSAEYSYFRTFCPYTHLKTTTAPLTFATKFSILPMFSYWGYYALKRRAYKRNRSKWQ